MPFKKLIDRCRSKLVKYEAKARSTEVRKVAVFDAHVVKISCLSKDKNFNEAELARLTALHDIKCKKICDKLKRQAQKYRCMKSALRSLTED
jgi:ribonuclease PH